MNKKTIAFSFILIVGITGLLFWFFSKVSHEILLGLFAGLVPSLVILHIQNRKNQVEHHNWLLRNKEAFLTEIVDIFISPLHDEKGSEKAKNDKILKRLNRFLPALFVWGSPSIFRAWSELIQSTDPDSLEDSIKKYERFFRAIRKELGYDDSSLAPGEVSAILLKLEDKQKALDACKDEIYK